MSFCLRSKILEHYSKQNTNFRSLLGLNRVHSSSKISFRQRSMHYAGGIGGPTPGHIELQEEDTEEFTQTERKKVTSNLSLTLFKMFESAATTFASILVLGLAGYGYHRVCIYWEQDVFSDLLFDLPSMLQQQNLLVVVRTFSAFGSLCLEEGMLIPKSS